MPDSTLVHPSGAGRPSGGSRERRLAVNEAMLGRRIRLTEELGIAVAKMRPVRVRRAVPEVEQQQALPDAGDE